MIVWIAYGFYALGSLAFLAGTITLMVEKLTT